MDEHNPVSRPVSFSRKRFLKSLYLTELVLLLLALGIAKLFEGSFFPFDLHVTAESLLLGVLSAVPLAMLIILATFGPVSRVRVVDRAMNRISDRLQQIFGSTILKLTVLDIVLLSTAAGIAEEVFFRGMVQSYIGVIASAVIFGLLHALTPAYFVMATAIGLYFGYLYAIGGNLLVPIVGHAAYDIFALYLLQWQFGKEKRSGDEKSI